MPEEENESPLERARRRLFENKPVEASGSDGLVSAPAPRTSKGWKEELPSTKPKFSLAALFLMAAAGFFVLAGLTAALILFLGGRSISSDRIDISIEGPTTIAGGDTVPLFVVLENNNPIAATNVTLSIDFPEGAYSADDKTKALGHYAVPVDDIPSGVTARESVRAIFFGAENQSVKIPITLEYRTEGSNAVFVKKKEYEFTITTAPLSVNVSTLSEVGAGQSFTILATVRSNALTTLENVAVHAVYPFGFVATNASPDTVGENVFPLGTFEPGEEKEIRITGTLTGQDGDTRVFKFFAGALPNPEATKIGEPAYTQKDATVSITKSFLELSMFLNREEKDPLVVSGGEQVTAALTWMNTLSSTIADGEVKVAISGDAADLSNLKAQNGFYRSGDRTVVFNRDTEKGLRSLAPEDSGSGSFAFMTKTGSALAKLRNPSITLTVSIAGRRVSEGQVQESLSSTLKRTIQIATDLKLDADIVRNVGPFKNTGPLPPQVDRETTYTVRWGVSNSVNSVANAKVSVVLPSYVRFTGETTGAVTYNETTREVSWELGDVAAGTSQSAAFKIGFTPSASQQGSTPILLPPHSVTGFDRFVKQEVTGSVDRLTTEMGNDPTFKPEDDRVQ